MSEDEIEGKEEEIIEEPEQKEEIEEQKEEVKEEQEDIGSYFASLSEQAGRSTARDRGGIPAMSPGVHNIHITVDDTEYKALVQAKGDLTWHDYLCREI